MEESIKRLNPFLIKDKIILTSVVDKQKFKKQDLMNYITHLQHKYNTIFETHASFEKFYKKTRREKKLQIVEIINYYVEVNNIRTTIKVQVKGTKYPELVNVYVKKVVRKVV